MGDNERIHDLEDVRRQGCQLGIRCRCGHAGTIDIAKTLRWFACHCWSTVAVAASRHFRCSKCRRKGQVRLWLSSDHPRDHGVYPATEEGWTRLRRRLRG